MYAIVGSIYSDISGKTNQGAAYIFTRSGTTWTQQAKLVASDGATNDRFGRSVDISDNGEYVAVGAWFDDVDSKTDQGAVYIFTRSGTTWTQQAKLVASDGAAHDNFGHSVAISDNGEYVVIGSINSDIATKVNQGAAYIFVRSGSTWTQQAKLVASDGAAGDRFGYSVAISGNGARVIISAPYYDTDSGTNVGAVYTFDRSGTSWSQQQSRLIASDGVADDAFGFSVDIANDGSCIVVGARDAKVGANDGQGKAYIFTRSETAWGQNATLTASDGLTGDRFGHSVSISTNGDYVLIGARNAKVGANDYQGRAYIFTRSTVNLNSWYQRSILTASDGASGDSFGESLSTNGEYNIIGAAYDDIGSNTDQGSAYIFA